MKNLIYAALCFMLVLALLSFQPGDTTTLTKVDDELLQQAEDMGLLTVELPAGAENTTFNGCEVDGTLTGEVYFELNGVVWCYRCAEVPFGGTELPDLSELDGDFANVQDTQVLGCQGKISVTGGETGKIVWYDGMSGLAYSLTMASDADGDKLQSIANYMFEPVK